MLSTNLGVRALVALCSSAPGLPAFENVAMPGLEYKIAVAVPRL